MLAIRFIREYSPVLTKSSFKGVARSVAKPSVLVVVTDLEWPKCDPEIDHIRGIAPK